MTIASLCSSNIGKNVISDLNIHINEKINLKNIKVRKFVSYKNV